MLYATSRKQPKPTVTTRPTAILLISCPDQEGSGGADLGILFQNGGNIIHADNHIDAETGLFLMRVEWELDGFQILARKSPRDLHRSRNG